MRRIGLGFLSAAMLVPAAAFAAPGDTLQTAIQKGVNFTVADVVAFDANGCVACHRQGASLFGLSQAAATGYAVDLSASSGIGHIANTTINWQTVGRNNGWVGPGGWSHYGWYNNSVSSYAIFGLSGYDQFVSTRYSSNLVAAADWALSVQAGDGSWPEEHGYWPTTASTLETTARFTFGLAQAIRRVDSARAAQYQASLERAVGYLSSRGLSANGSLGGFYTFQLAYALLAYKNAGAANNDPNVVALRNYLLARFNTGDGSGWGYGDGVGSNHYDTGIALYALCQAGERLTNASISAAATYLNNTQTDQGNGGGYWASPYFGSVDIPTIFAVLGLSCFGSVGVHTQAVGPSRQQIDAQDDATQTRTFTVRVSNTGNFATQDTFNIGVLGGLPGFSVALSANVLTIAAGEEQDVTVQVGVPARVAFGSEATYSIVATSRTNGSANSSTTLTLFTSEPPAAGQATQTWFFGNLGPGLTVTSVSQPVRLGVTVVNPQATPLQGPNIGVVTFFVGGFAVGSDGDANGDGLFELDWIPGADWNRLGQQDLRAIYSGIDQPGPGIDYLSSFTSGVTITVNTDDDGDGIPNDIETGVVGTNPTLADTDGDGCGDGLEHFTMRSNPRVADTDGDGFGDCSERNVGTDPLQAGSFPDVDHDGVSDIADLFPCDPLRSAAVFSPGEGEYGTLMFEDNWPVRGDLDFNDAVLAYNSTLYLGSNGGVTGLRLTIVPRAIGAKERSGLAIRLPTSITALRSATRSVAGGAPSSISAVADGERDVVVNISTNLREFWSGADGFINTAANGFNPGNGQQVVVELLFAAPVAINLAQDPFDLFFYRTGDFSHQVHRPQYSGTAAMNTALFNSGNDGSTATRHFVDTAGLPYVLSVPSLISWPYEQMRIEVQFPGIVGFASSGGTEGADYYLRPSGFGAVSASSQIAGVPGVVSDLSCRPTDRNYAATCAEVLAAQRVAPSGLYTIDVDGSGPLEAFSAWCDMSFDGGGWTLYLNTEGGTGPDRTTVGEVRDGVSSRLATDVMLALAARSREVHVRRPDSAPLQFITSLPDNQVISNVRQGLLLNQGLPSNASRYFRGTQALPNFLDYYCGTGGGYPNLYWACGNFGGTHITSGHSRWTWDGGSTYGNFDVQAYLR